jgi:hypothetical protein
VVLFGSFQSLDDIGIQQYWVLGSFPANPSPGDSPTKRKQFGKGSVPPPTSPSPTPRSKGIAPTHVISLEESPDVISLEESPDPRATDKAIDEERNENDLDEYERRLAQQMADDDLRNDQEENQEIQLKSKKTRNKK